MAPIAHDTRHDARCASRTNARRLPLRTREIRGMSVKFFERLAGPRGELIREAHHGNGDGVAYAG
jgi:hypothetical protein